MNINKDNISYKVFVFAKLFTRRFWKDEYMTEQNIPANTNLCQFIRVTYVWMPLTILLMALILLGAGWVTFVLPAYLGGLYGYINTYIIPGVVFGTIFGIGYGINTTVNHFRYSRETYNEMVERHERGDYTMLEIIIQYLKATKDKVCPLISFK